MAGNSLSFGDFVEQERRREEREQRVQPQPVDTAAQFNAFVTRERDKEAQMAASLTSTAEPLDVQSIELAGDAERELGQKIPLPAVKQNRESISQQVQASKMLRLFRDAPQTARWATTLENAQFVRQDPELMAHMEYVFDDPWTVPGQVADTFKGLGRAVPATIGSGLRGASITAATEEQAGIEEGIERLEGTIKGTQERLEHFEEQGETQLAQQTRERLGFELRHVARDMSGDVRDRAYEISREIDEGRPLNEALTDLQSLRDAPRAVEDRPVYEAGEWIGERLQESLRAGRAYEDTLATQFGEGLGSFAAFMAVGASTGKLGSFGLATAAGIDEQYQRATEAGLDQEDALRYAWQGAPAGFVQAISVEFALRRLPLPAHRRGTVVARDLGYTGLAEMMVETSGGIMQNLIEQQYNPERGTFEDTFVQGILSGSGAATMRGLMLSMNRGARRGLFKDIERAEASTELERTFDAIRDGLEGNDLRQAAPERFRGWAEQIAAGRQRETVYLSPEGLQQMTESLDPDALNQVIEVLPGVDRDAFDRAIEQGSDLAIPTSTWMTDVIGTQFDTALTQHIRFDPADMTISERVTGARDMQREMAEVSSQIAQMGREEAMAQLTPEQQARAQIFEEARATIAQAGQTAQASEAIAAQYAAFMARRAAVNQIPVDEFLRRFPVPDINLGDTVVDMRGPRSARRDAEEVLGEVREAPDQRTEDAETLRAALEEIGVDVNAVTDMDAIEALRTASTETAADVDAPQDPVAAETGEATTEATPPRLQDPTRRARVREILDRPQRQRAQQVARPGGQGPYTNARPEEVVPYPATLTQGMRQPDRVRDIEQWRSDIRRAQAEKYPGTMTLRVGANAAPLRALGVRGGAVGLDAKALRKLATKHTGLTTDFLLNLPEYFANPVAILETPDHSTSSHLLLTSAKNSAGAPIAIAFEDSGGTGRTRHRIPTAYPLWGEADPDAATMPNWIGTARLVYRDETMIAAGDRALHLPDDPFVGRERAEALAAKLNTRRTKNILSREDVVNITGLEIFQSQPGAPVHSTRMTPDGGPAMGEFDTLRSDVVFGTELEGDGLKFASFFADVTEGARQQPTRLIEGEVEYTPAIELTDSTSEFQQLREKYTGHFDQHIQTSIPGFYEVQAVVGEAIAQTYSDGGRRILDIGASEGAMMKAVAERAQNLGRTPPRAVAFDPSPSMQATFDRMGGPPQVRFQLAAFGSAAQEGQPAWTETDADGNEVAVNFFDPAGPKFDVVHEAMVFQFISNGRGAQVQRVKELMKPGGIAIFEQKFGGPADQYNANEALKDEYKALYYTEDQLAAKRAEVLQSGGDAIEGMTDLQASQAEFEATLALHFDHVVQFWSSGNFKGYAASDSKRDLDRLIGNMQSTRSDYSVEATPRDVFVEVDAENQTARRGEDPMASVVEGRPQLRPRASDGMVELHHWSNSRLDTIDPNYAGTGPVRGDERTRGGPNKTYYGLAPRNSPREPGHGYVRESGLGPIHHISAIDPQRLYPFYEDPDGLRLQLDPGLERHRQLDAYEDAIRDAGYAGYYTTEDGSGRSQLGTVAVVFEATTPETAYDEDAGQVLYQDSPEEGLWYSALGNAVQNAKQGKAKAKDWKAIISKLPGVKRAEIDWYGVDEWLDSRGDETVSRDQLHAYIRSQQVEVSETVLGAGGITGANVAVDFVELDAADVSDADVEAAYEQARYDDDLVHGTVLESMPSRFGFSDEWGDTLRQHDVTTSHDEATVFDAVMERLMDRLLDRMEGTYATSPDGADIEGAVDAIVAELFPEALGAHLSSVEEIADTQAAEMAGREMSADITGPDGEFLRALNFVERGDGSVFDYDTGGTFDSRSDFEDAIRDRINENPEEILLDAASAGGDPQFEQYTEAGGERYREILLTVPDLDQHGPNAYRQGVSPFVEEAHFSEPNVVVHMRVKDRRGPAGNAVMFAEEVQSDLAKKWRDLDMRIPPSVVRQRAREMGVEGDAAQRFEGLTMRYRRLATDRDVARRDQRRRIQNVGELAQRIDPAAAEGAAVNTITAMSTANVFVMEQVDADEAARVRSITADDRLDSGLMTVLERAYASDADEYAQLRADVEGVRTAYRDTEQAIQEIARLRTEASAVFPTLTSSQIDAALNTGELPGDPAQDLVDREVDALAEERRALQEDAGPDAQARIREIERRVSTIDSARVQDTPMTPFEAQTSYELGAKRLIMEAAREGYDALAWTPGAMQGARWNGRVVETVGWWSPPDAADGRKIVSLSGTRVGGAMTIDASGFIVETDAQTEEFKGRSIEALLGKRTAGDIGASDHGRLDHLSQLLGGDGYRIAYDQQLKQFIERWAKKYGGKVEARRDLPDFTDPGALDVFMESASPSEFDEMASLSGMRRRYADHLEEARLEEQALIQERQQRAARLQGFIAMLERDAAALRRGENPRLEPPEGAPSFVRRGYHEAHDLIKYAEGTPEEGAASLDEVRETAQRGLQSLTGGAADGVVDTSTAEANAEVRAKSTMKNELVNLFRRGIPPEVIERFPGAAPTGRPVWFIEITDQMRAAAQKPQPLFQTNRGKIILPPRGAAGQRPVITLFETSDLSTLLHESGHYYLHVLQELAESDELRGRDAQDWQTIQNWWRQNAEAVAEDAGGGVTAGMVRRYLDERTTGDGEMDRRINVGLQEQWARGLERFLLEGKAPNAGLREAFESFKAWLISVYQRAEALRVNVSPEMRDVFERMFAAEEEIAFARAEDNVDALVAQSAEELGVSQEEYQRLVDLGEQAREESERQLLAEIMRPIREQQRAEYRQRREAVEAEVRDELLRQPVHRLREWLGNQRWLGEEDAPSDLPTDMRLDRQMLVDRYGEDILRLLPRGRAPLFSRRGEQGMNPDDVAGWFGFESGDAMIQELQRTPSLPKHVDAEVRERMLAEQDDPMADNAIEDEARAAMHNEHASRLLVAEMRAIAKGGGVRGRATPKAQAREVARRTIRGMPVREALRSHVYQNAERRAAQQAQEALAAGDRQAAFDAKRRQLMNHMLYSESRRAADTVEQLENRAGRLRRKGTRQNLAGEYLEAIDEILDTYEFRRVSNRQLDRRNALRNYIEMMESAGRENELAIPPEVIEQTDRVNYRELTVQHAEGVLDSLRNIEHTARFKEKLRRQQDQRNLDEVVDRVAAQFRANVPDDPRGRVRSRRDRRRGAVREFMNLTLKAGTILRKIGGFEDHGAAEVEIKREIDAATRDLTRRRIDLTDRLDELYAVYSRTEMNDMAVKRHRPEVNASMSKWDIISVALNMGNVDNLARLTDPDSRGFTRHQIDQLVDTLDRRDWDFVQGMLDLIDSYWSEIAAREQRLTGVAPKKVEAVPIETKFGTYRGGYYPIMYDGELSAQVNNEETQELMKNTLAGKFGKAQTSQGHLKERTGGSGGRPLMLGMEVGHRHLGRVIHDLAMSEAVTNAWRILQHPQLRAEFERAGLLNDLTTLELWVQDVAAGQQAAADLPSRIFRRLKSNFTMAKLAFNVSTVAVQLTGLGQSAVLIGKQDFARGMMTYAGSVPRSIEAVMGKSEFMRQRQTTFNKDINDILNDVTVEAGPLESRIDHVMRRYAAPASFWMLQKVQFYAVDMPTWMAVYQRDLDAGLAEADAIANADAMVAQAQAGGEFADRSSFERGTLSRQTRQSDLVRMFTTLGSYMFAKANVAYERTGRMSRTMREEGVSAKSAAEAINYAFDMATLFVVEAILYAAIMGRLPGEDDEPGEWHEWVRFVTRESAAGVAATLPFARDLASVAQGFDPGGAYGGISGEAGDIVRRMAQVPGAMLDPGRDVEITDADIKAFVRGVGLASGLPSTMINRVIDGFWRSQVENEDVAPMEYLMGRRS